MIVKMIQDLGKRMEVKIKTTQEMFNKDLQELKNKQRMCMEDGGRVRHGDHLPSHRYSRNTSTRGTAPLTVSRSYSDRHAKLVDGKKD